MKLHANARTCPKSRRLLVKRVLEERWSLAAAAEAAGVSERTARKWLARQERRRDKDPAAYDFLDLVVCDPPVFASSKDGGKFSLEKE